MWCEGLPSQHRAVIGYRRFKAFRVDAPVGELALCLAFCFTADAGDVAEEVSEPAAEDVAFVVGHLQGFMDGVGEAVACEFEVLEHERGLEILPLLCHRTEPMEFKEGIKKQTLFATIVA